MRMESPSIKDRYLQEFSAPQTVTKSFGNGRVALTESYKPFWFSASFAGYMDMYSDLPTVAQYLANHEGWFCNCAKPMKVEPLDPHTYILNVGRFASLGYEVEPKVAIVLDPPQDNLYTMRTVPVPNYTPPGYEVQYKSFMELQSIALTELKSATRKKILLAVKSEIKEFTRVSWQLDIAVTVEFPKFIYRLPTNLVQSTGDRFLTQIVRQISPRLSIKVQQDFHLQRNLPIPDKSSRDFRKLQKESVFV